jgi:hypothetical protein
LIFHVQERGSANDTINEKRKNQPWKCDKSKVGKLSQTNLQLVINVASVISDAFPFYFSLSVPTSDGGATLPGWNSDPTPNLTLPYLTLPNLTKSSLA